MALLEPKEVTIKTQKGDDRVYVISKFPAIIGREIVAKYPMSNIPKIGDYGVSQEVMLKLMRHVAIKTASGEFIPLVSAELVENHVPDWEALARLEKATIEYNCSFFASGAISGFLEGFASTVRASTSKIVTDLLAQFSQMEKQHSKS